MGFAPPQLEFKSNGKKKKREREIITKDLRDTRAKSLSTVNVLLFFASHPKGNACFHLLTMSCQAPTPRAMQLFAYTSSGQSRATIP